MSRRPTWRPGLLLGAWLLAVAPTASAAGDGTESPPNALHFADARPPAATWLVSGTASGELYSIHESTLFSPASSASGSAQDLTLALTRYATPVEEDGAPYSLQPYLQRATRWGVSLDGHHFRTENLIGGPDRTAWWTSGASWVDAYLRSGLVAHASLGYQYTRVQEGAVDQRIDIPTGSAGFGLRWSDTRVDATLGLAKPRVDGVFESLRRTLTLSSTTVLVRRVRLGASAAIIPGGLSASVSVEAYATRRLGFFTSLRLEEGDYYVPSAPVRRPRWSSSVGFSYWLSAKLGIDATFTSRDEGDFLSSGSEGQYRESTHTLALQVFARLP